MIHREGHICGWILTKKLQSKCQETLDKLKFKDIIRSNCLALKSVQVMKG